MPNEHLTDSQRNQWTTEARFAASLPVIAAPGFRPNRSTAVFRSLLVAAVIAAGYTLTASTSLMAAEASQPVETSGDKSVDKLAGLAAISVFPDQISLSGSRGRQQLVVTGTFASGEVRDLTDAVTWSVSAGASSAGNEAAPAVVRLDSKHVLFATADGAATVTASIPASDGNLTATASVTVSNFGQPAPFSFKNEMIAALSKASCNMGACHGSPSGKGGFRLSLRGYDPALDLVTLRTEFSGRRTNAFAPDESLLLRKPLMELPHGGGRRLKKTDAAYDVLRGWISEGLRTDAADAPSITGIRLYPESRIFQQAGTRQQMVTLASFSDGTVRDVTPLTVYTTSNESLARVDDHGLVQKSARGEVAILARYLDKLATSYITFLEEVPGFQWSNPAENNFVDTLINEKLRQLQILPSDLCTDEEFVRRAYLDAAGRLPTLAEVQAFLASSNPSKRDQLVDYLVDTDDFASYWSLLLGDVLRANSKRLTATGVQKFRLWLYEAIRNDMPYDQFAKALLTARGSSFKNPAAAYWRSSRDPQDATETTAQLFLGVRIQCAKCHNHPFERWTQDNYYGIGAAFARIGRKPGLDPEDEVVFTATGGEVVQPRTGQAMKVHLLLTGDVDVPATTDRREVFADWLVSAENPFFARSAVNRIWGQIMGRGIVEPVDDFRDSNPPSNAPLLNRLASEFAANGFSRKWVVRTIMKSRTYQLSSRKNSFNENDELYNSHASTRMLTAEQLLDSISAVTNVPEQFPGVPLGTRATELSEPPTDNYFLKVFGQPQREMACQCERSTESNLSQALQMINGTVVHNKLRSDTGRIATSLAAGKSDDEIIDELYLVAVSRHPTTEERAAAQRHLAAAGAEQRRAALEDIGWAILNTKEFLFQH